MRRQGSTTTICLVALVFLAIAATLFVAFGYFVDNTSKEISERTNRKLETRTAQQVRYVETVLDGQFASLESAAAYLGAAYPGDRTDFETVVAAMQTSLNFARYTVADVQGDSLTSDGVAGNVAHRDYFHNALAGERTVTEPFLSNVDANYVCVMLAVPITTADGEIVGVLGGSYTSEYFGSLFLDGNLETQDVAFLSDEEGNVIVSTPTDGIALTGLNIFEEITNFSFLDGKSVEDVRSAMSNNEALTTLADNGVEEIYTTQIPFGYNGWTLFSAVDRNSIDEAYAFINTNMNQMNITVTATFAGGLLCMLLIFSRERNRLRKDNLRIQDEKMRLALSEEKYRLIARDSDIIVFEINMAEKTIEHNENFVKQFGPACRYECFVEGGRVHPDDLGVYRGLIKSLYAHDEHVEGRLRCLDDAGKPTWYSVDLSSVMDESGEIARVLGKLMNIDETVRTMELLQLEAQTDSMTGLYDKEATEALIADTLKEHEADRTSHLAIAIVDIDDLKTINDTLGHLQGDQAIRALSSSLKSNFRDTDIIGRIGGDEFMVCIKGLEGEGQARTVIESFVAKSADLTIGERNDVPLHRSIGVAMAQPGDTFEMLYKQADAALYHVKNHGKNGFAFWHSDLRKDA